MGLEWTIPSFNLGNFANNESYGKDDNVGSSGSTRNDEYYRNIYGPVVLRGPNGQPSDIGYDFGDHIAHVNNNRKLYPLHYSCYWYVKTSNITS